MRLKITQRKPVNPEEWHWKFAWLPTRISPTEVVWLDGYERRRVTTAEGCWAGGWRFRYEYASTTGIWLGQEYEE